MDPPDDPAELTQLGLTPKGFRMRKLSELIQERWRLLVPVPRRAVTARARAPRVRPYVLRSAPPSVSAQAAVARGIRAENLRAESSFAPSRGGDRADMADLAGSVRAWVALREGCDPSPRRGGGGGRELAGVR
ncbi:hypothetical protein GCM10027570_52720 [Streptomonospora sediminis]